MTQFEPASETEKQIRLDIIKALIVGATQRRDIVKYCLEKHPDWNVTDRQIRNYIDDAYQQLHVEATNIDFKRELQITKMQYDLAFAVALKQQTPREMVNAAKAKESLLGLDKLRYEPEWKDDARAAGIDPDELLAGFFASKTNAEIIIGTPNEPSEPADER